MGCLCTLRFNKYTLLKCLYKTKYITSRSAVDLAHKIHGKGLSEGGKPVIVLHGLLGSKRNWESMSKNIASATHTTVVAVDARNHGESPHVNSHTYLDLASDVSQLLNKLSVNNAFIIGHSMGGRTGMVLALTEPSKVASLIVVDISPVSTAGILNDFFPKLIDVMKTVDFQGFDNVGKARIAAKDKILASGIIENVESMSFILMNIGMRKDKSIGWMCNIYALKQYFTTIATFPNMTGKTYPGPTLFIGGDQSNYIPPEDITGIRGFFPKAELKYISGVGHNVHAEDPKAFLSLVTDFLAKI